MTSFFFLEFGLNLKKKKKIGNISMNEIRRIINNFKNFVLFKSDLRSGSLSGTNNNRRAIESLAVQTDAYLRIENRRT